MRTDYVLRDQMEHLLAALTPANRLAIRLSMATGLRISDVLGIKTSQLKNRFTVRECKTGKNKSVRLSNALLDDCLLMAGRIYLFSNRLDYRKHRTRQAVFKDLKRISKLFRLKENVAPHTARKIFAVESFAKSKDIKKVKKLLNHSSEAVTVLYAFADELVDKH